MLFLKNRMLCRPTRRRFLQSHFSRTVFTEIRPLYGCFAVPGKLEIFGQAVADFEQSHILGVKVTILVVPPLLAALNQTKQLEKTCDQCKQPIWYDVVSSCGIVAFQNLLILLTFHRITKHCTHPCHIPTNQWEEQGAFASFCRF